MQNDNGQQQASQNNRTGDEIISGANNESQLDSLKETASTQGTREEATQQGTEPSTGDENLDTGDGQTNRSEIDQPGDDGSGAELGGITNLSLDQLKKEGDNNDTNIL
ncbi:hypothetical protein [Mucilaginibacter sp. HD30]